MAVIDEETKVRSNQGRMVLETGEDLDGDNLTEKEDLTLAQTYIDKLEGLLAKGEVGGGALYKQGKRREGEPVRPWVPTLTHSSERRWLHIWRKWRRGDRPP